MAHITHRVYFRKLDKGTHTRNLGGNMKTHLAVYEESLFDLRGGGGKLFKGGKWPYTLYMVYMYCNTNNSSRLTDTL